MIQFNFNVETTNGFKGNVVVKSYDGLAHFYADVETSFGIISINFSERDMYDTSIKSIEDILIRKIELEIDSRIERLEKNKKRNI